MTAPRIRSYVLRQARMSPLQQRSFDTLYDTYSLPLSDFPVDLQHAFGSLRQRLGVPGTPGAEQPREIILEIGFGMGSATVEIAEANPNRDYLGIEVHTPGVGKVLSEIGRRKLSNLLLIRADAVEVLSKMISGHSLGGVHIFFPDPWPKKRHHKRRLVQPDFARLVAEKIRANGYLYIVTDWEDYALSMLDVLERTLGIANTSESFAPPAPWRPRTRFEQKGLDRAHAIFELFFRRIVQS